MKIKFIGCLLACLFSWGLSAQEKSTSLQARQVFDEVYQKVFGPQGAALRYKVDIVGIYKTEGRIWYKGKKSRYQSSNSKSWNDGVTAYLVKDKKRTVEIFKASSSKQETRTPLSLRIKVAFFWVSVDISDVKSGGIKDEEFVFPRNQYRGYEMIDRRNEE